MDALLQDIRFGWRSLRWHRGFSVVAITTLALGIGATTALFSVVHGVLLRPLPYPDSDRIVTVWETARGQAARVGGGLLSHPNFLDVQRLGHSFESVAQVNGVSLTVVEEGGAELVRGARVTPEFFHVFRVSLESGRTFTSDEDRLGGPKVAVVSSGYWHEQLGGRANVLGSSIQINGASHQIVGVAASGFDFPSAARIWLPAQNNDVGCGRGCFYQRAVARLVAGASVESARTELTKLGARLESVYPATNTGTTFAAASLRDVTVGDVRPALLLLLGAVLVVALIACANVANLLVVRGHARAAEIAVRSTLGASRPRLFSQLLTESLLLAWIGGVLGVILAQWGVDAVQALAPTGAIPRLGDVRVDATTLLFAVGLSSVTSILFGLAPAIQLTRAPLADWIRRGGRSDVSRGRTAAGRSLVVAGEVALSVVLVLGAGLLVRSLERLNGVNPGFDSRDIALFRLSLPDARYGDPGDVVRFMERLQERLAAVPGMQEVAVMVAPPLGNSYFLGEFTRTDRPAPPPGRSLEIDYRVWDAKALAMLHIPVLRGRGFLPTDRHGGQSVAVINQSAAQRYFQGEDPIGKAINVTISTGFEETTPRTIVGIVGDVRSRDIRAEPPPALYLPFAQVGASTPHVLMRATGDVSQVMAIARQQVAAMDSGLPLIEPGTLAGFVDRQLAQTRFNLVLLSLFSFLALLLATVGLYGVIAYTVSQRQREIGLRLALGSQVRQVMQLVLWQGFRPAAAGITLGLVSAWLSGRLMRGLVYGVQPHDLLTFVLVPTLFIIVALLACGVPALRASHISPATALRGD
jgi:putative ABC transport system permease protein